MRKLRCFLELLRRGVLTELVGDPETLVVDSTLLLVLHPRQVGQSAGWGSRSAGAAWVRWGSFSVYGVKLHLVGVMGAGLLVFVRNDLEAVVEVNQGQRAFNLADAGVQAARRELLS